MRIVVALVLALAVTAVAAGQSRRSQDDARTSLPPIGLPLPEIGLPLPSIGLSGADEQPAKRGDRRPTPPDRRRGGDRRGGRPTKGNVVVVPVPVYGWGYAPPQPVPDPAPAEPAQPPSPAESIPQEPIPPTGVLTLDLQPSRNGQLFVDGYYVGTTDDLGGELTLEAGPHSIEVRAPGYQPVSVNVKIEPGRGITYRSALQPMSQAKGAEAPVQAADAKPAEQKPFYFIPGCYLGNVPPKDARLPATCDPKRATTIKP